MHGGSVVTKGKGRDVRVVALKQKHNYMLDDRRPEQHSVLRATFIFNKCFAYRACAAVPTSTTPIPQESAWELPPSAREVAPQDTTAAAATALVPVQEASSYWTRVLDDSTNTTYFFNTSTQVHACCGAAEPSSGVSHEWCRRLGHYTDGRQLSATTVLSVDIDIFMMTGSK